VVVVRLRVASVVVATGALAASGLAVLTARPAGATTVSVANETEYRNALTTLSSDASGPHTIDVTADITLSAGTDPIYTGSQPLTITGNGHTLGAGGTSRVLLQNTTAALIVDDLIVTGGNSSGNGGAIEAGGSVTITNSTVSANTAASGGGGVHAASATLTKSIVGGNTAGFGAGLFAGGWVTVTSSTVSGNTAQFGGGGVFGGGRGAVTVTGSTVSGNTAGAGGGGILAQTAATVTNSTVSGNSSTDRGGGILAPELTLIYATVGGNGATAGANISVETPDTLNAFASVVALPGGGGGNCLFAAGQSTVSSGYNWDDDGSCGFGSGPGDRSNGGDPLLAALADNAGTTQTRLPEPGSLLIDAIPADACRADSASDITTDQRGVARPQSTGCDIGAVEVATAAAEAGAPVPAVVAVPRFTG
jgi:predicted outer membrane repeat protein